MARILVIEDDPTQRLLATKVLEDAGHQIVQADSGEIGLASAQIYPPDVIVCDVVMPGLNGFDLVTALKKDLVTANILVIFVSAMKERSHVRIGMNAGADDYISKPYTAKELRDSVDTLLRKRDAQRAHFSEKVRLTVATALSEQKAALSSRYEQQLLRELDDRWSQLAGTDSETTLANAPVLLVDVFGPITAEPVVSKDLSASLRRLYQAASDTLLLFGARHVLVNGANLVAVFTDKEDSPPGALTSRAIRAALALPRALASALSSIIGKSGSPAALEAALDRLTIGLHSGPVSLIHIQDPLHGGIGASIVAGAGMTCAMAVQDLARSRQWPIGVSAKVLAGHTAHCVIRDTATLAPASDKAALQVMELQSMKLP